MFGLLKAMLAEDSGSNAIEYALIGGVIGLMLIPAVPPVAAAIQPLFQALADGFAIAAP